METKRKYYTIDELCTLFGIKCPKHIVFNAKLTRLSGAQYDIVRNVTHDGTAVFTKQLLWQTIEGLIKMLKTFSQSRADTVKF